MTKVIIRLCLHWPNKLKRTIYVSLSKTQRPQFIFVDLLRTIFHPEFGKGASET